MAAAIVDASVAAEEEDRNDNYVEDLAEDVGPRDRRIPVWKSDFRSARAGRRVGDGTNATRVLITESVNSPSTRRPREAAAAARSMCGVRGAAFLLVGRLL